MRHGKTTAGRAAGKADGPPRKLLRSGPWVPATISLVRVSYGSPRQSAPPTVVVFFGSMRFLGFAC